MPGVVQSDPPHGQHWLTALIEVSRTIRDPERIDQVLPILLKNIGNGRGVRPADVILNRKCASVLRGRRNDISKDDVPGTSKARYIRNKSLNENTVKPVIPHPLEVPCDRFAIPGREEICRRRTNRHVRDGAEFVSIELRKIRVHVDLQRGG
jgi:hypothetical protein